jgi:hypothetical protein
VGEYMECGGSDFSSVEANSVVVSRMAEPSRDSTHPPSNV